MSRRFFLFLLALTLIAALLAGCNDSGSGQNEQEIEIPDAEIAGYVAELTDASFTLTLDGFDGEMSIDGKVKGTRAEIAFFDGEDTNKSVFVLDDGYSYGYLVSGDEKILCEKTPYSTERTEENEEEVEESYKLSYFLDRAEKDVREHVKGFYWKKYVSIVGDKMSFSYESGNSSVGGSVRVGAGEMGDESFEKPVFSDVTAEEIDGYENCYIYTCAEIDGEVVVALSYHFEGEKARLDILFRAYGVWFRQVNYLLKEGDRLYFYSREEEWQYTDLYSSFTPSSVVKTTAELLLVINNLNLSDVFGNGYYCAMDGEPGILRGYLAESDVAVVCPEEMSGSKDKAERIVNF